MPIDGPMPGEGSGSFAEFTPRFFGLLRQLLYFRTGRYNARMKITRVTTAVIEGNFDWTIVRVETDEDLQGFGECYFAPGLTTIVAELGLLLVGEDPRDVRRLFRKMQMAASGAGSVAGIVYNAITGIETALWDVSAKAAGVPLYRMLGGKFRSKVRIYADCHAGEGLDCLDCLMRSRSVAWQTAAESRPPANYFEETSDKILFTPEMYRVRARDMAALGFTALKFDVDVPNPYARDVHNRCLSNQEIDYMLNLIAGAREGAGPEVDLAIDCHWRFTLKDARILAKECETFRLMWLEDPLPPWAGTEFRDLRLSSSTPIATGENLYLFEGFRPLLEQHCLSVASPDLQKVGGLNEARRIAEYADSFTVPIAPHNISSPIGTLAAVHFCASIPNFLVLEFHASEVPFWSDLVHGGPGGLIVQGHFTVPEAPGLGLELDEDVARQYARPGEKFFAEAGVRG
jgi:L-alanine-DL-glutamate epimerase-like enolase superfamily enzyme